MTPPNDATNARRNVDSALAAAMTAADVVIAAIERTEAELRWQADGIRTLSLDLRDDVRAELLASPELHAEWIALSRSTHAHAVDLAATAKVDRAKLVHIGALHDVGMLSSADALRELDEVHSWFR